jgi:hypothetical protein
LIGFLGAPEHEIFAEKLPEVSELSHPVLPAVCARVFNGYP